MRLALTRIGPRNYRADFAQVNAFGTRLRAATTEEEVGLACTPRLSYSEADVRYLPGHSPAGAAAIPQHPRRYDRLAQAKVVRIDVRVSAELAESQSAEQLNSALNELGIEEKFRKG